MGFPLSPTENPLLLPVTTTPAVMFAPDPGHTDVGGGRDGMPHSAQADGNWRDGLGNDPTLKDLPCDCANCTGELYEADSSNAYRGYQCRPNAFGMAGGTCMQVGDRKDWVVQTEDELTYERFCLFTCKPLLPKRITTLIPCAPLSKWERKLEAQTPSGNGREFVFRANPMTEADPWPDFSNSDAEDLGPKDPVAQLAATFAMFGGDSEKDEAPTAGDDGCTCECEVSYAPSPGAEAALKAMSAMMPGALYPTPPPTMPPPPPMPEPLLAPPPMPPPAPPLPAAVPPLPRIPVDLPMPVSEELPTVVPPAMPTWQPTPPPPAMPPPPVPGEGAPPGPPGPAGPFAGMLLQEGAPPLAWYPPGYGYAQPPPPPLPAGFFPMPPPLPPQWGSLAVGGPGPPMPPLPPFAGPPAPFAPWGPPTVLLEEGHHPMRFQRPLQSQSRRAPVQAACAAKKCRTRCAAVSEKRAREASLWEAQQNAVRRAHSRNEAEGEV